MNNYRWLTLILVFLLLIVASEVGYYMILTKRGGDTTSESQQQTPEGQKRKTLTRQIQAAEANVALSNSQNYREGKISGLQVLGNTLIEEVERAKFGSNKEIAGAKVTVGFDYHGSVMKVTLPFVGKVFYKKDLQDKGQLVDADGLNLEEGRGVNVVLMAVPKELNAAEKEELIARCGEKLGHDICVYLQEKGYGKKSDISEVLSSWGGGRYELTYEYGLVPYGITILEQD